METKGFAPPWTTDRFAMLDYCLIQDRWKNAIVNVECKPNIAINSDHAMLVSKVRKQLKGIGSQHKTNSKPITRKWNIKWMIT